MPVTSYDVEELEALTEGSNKFAIELYQALKKPNKNLIVSPISVQIVLALAYTGAGGNTATEIAKVLHLPDNNEDVLKGHKLLLEQLQDPVLKLATKMFIEKTLEVKPEFQEGASKYFLSDAGLVNFVADPEGSRKEINQWVEQKTNNKIKDLLKEGTVDSLTRMILTNAIHFKANWASKFNDNLTRDGDFYITPENKVKVKMMIKSAKFQFKHHPELKAKILELPYENKEFRMIVILPDEINGLTEVENKLSTLNLAEILLSLYEVTVNVKLPKFKMEETMELKDTLTQLGIKDLFDQRNANLTGIADNLYASSAVQKAFIEVNEEGTEAAAATVVGILLILTMPVTMHDVKELEALTEGSNKFAIELYQALKQPNKNLIVSPISVQTVLALAYTGAGGNTATEIAKVLHLPDNMEDVLEGHKLLLEQLEAPVLKLATKMFIEKTLDVKPEFRQRASKYFLSDAGLVDFVANPEVSREEINQWVEQKTNNKIKDLLAKGTVDSSTSMILTNAIHFKGNWASKFNDKLTRDGDFYITPDNKVKVKMMFQNEKFPFKYLPELKAKILELPYENKEFKMIIVLPDEINGLTEVENKLSTLNLTEILLSLKEVTVNVKLPRFKMELTMELTDTLKQLGIQDLFDHRANLNGIADNLYASSVIQKAFIEVNENGTEAAAATAVLLFRSARSQEENFVADHPFMYFIYKNRVPLFVGSINYFENSS